MRHLTLQNARHAALDCLVALSLAVPSLGREWKSAGNGLTLNAELVAFDGKTAKLKLDVGGQVFSVRIDKLRDEDQAYLKTTYPDGLKDTTNSDDKPADAPAEPAPAAPETPNPAKPKRPVRVATAPSPTNVAAPEGISVEVVSLTVTRPSKFAGDGAAFITPGTHITLLVSDPSRTIVGLDSEKSKITECIDDRSTNLTQPSGDGSADDEATVLMLEAAPDGKSGTIELSQPQAPNPKATRIRIRGELHLTCGAGENTESVRVPLNVIIGIGL